MLVLLVSTVFCGLFSKVDLGFHFPYNFTDLGHQLYNYKMTALGEAPYRDFWENWTPGAFYLNALALKVFGMNIYSTKLLLAITVIVSIMTLFSLSRRVVPEPVAAATTAVALLWGNFTLNIPYSGWFSTCFGLLALLWLVKFFENNDRSLRWLLLTGFALGGAFSCKQNIGGISLLALATALAFGTCALESPADMVSSGCPRKGLFLFLNLVLVLALLIPTCIVLPFLFIRTLMTAGLKAGFGHQLLFFAPVLLLDLGIILILSRVLARKETAVVRCLFLRLVRREVVLLAGFGLVVLPWFVYFSEMLGWSEFYRIVLTIHPVQQTFKRLYPVFGQLAAFPLTKAVSFGILTLMCGGICILSIFGKSRKSLGTSMIASFFLLLGLWKVAIPVQASSGDMLYLPLFLEAGLAVFFVAQWRRSAGWLKADRRDFIVLSVAIFAFYNYMSLALFADGAHYQMIVFPWIFLVGFLFTVFYEKACSLLINPAYAKAWRKAAIVGAVAVPLFGPFVGKSLSMFKAQLEKNADYCKKNWVEGYGERTTLLKRLGNPVSGIYVNRAFLLQMEEVLEHIQQNTTAEDYVFTVPAAGVVNFLSGREYPSKYRYFLFDFLSEEQQSRLLEDLNSNQPKLIIVDIGLSADLYRDTLKLISYYIESGYGLETKGKRFMVFTRDHKTAWRNSGSPGSVNDVP